jgi:hypothetical protein
VDGRFQAVRHTSGGSTDGGWQQDRPGELQLMQGPVSTQQVARCCWLPLNRSPASTLLCHLFLLACISVGNRPPPHIHHIGSCHQSSCCCCLLLLAAVAYLPDVAAAVVGVAAALCPSCGAPPRWCPAPLGTWMPCSDGPARCSFCPRPRLPVQGDQCQGRHRGGRRRRL